MLDFSVTFIITILNIVILTLILRLILFKPVTKFMAERAKRVQDSIDQSERDKAEAKAMLSRYEDKLKSARAEADDIIRNAKEKAQEEAARITGEGRAAAETTMQNARKQIDAERDAAMESFKKEAAVLVTAASGRLLAREIKDDDNLHLAEQLLDAVNAGSGGNN